MSLTDITIKAAKPKAKPYKLADSQGLYLEVAPSGGKWWRFKYRIAGKEKRLSLGVYPDVPLAGREDKSAGWINGARDRRDQARRLLAQGIDPGEHRKAVKATGDAAVENSFKSVALEWLAKFAPTWSVA